MGMDIGDRLALQELVHLYGHLVDDQAWHDLDRVFTSDVLYDATDFSMPVTRSLADLVAEWTSEEGLKRHPLAHHTTNLVLTEDDDGTVRLRSKGIGVGASGRVGSVVYDDVAVRTPVGWRLASRRVTLRRAEGLAR
jgi:3-phenylpropionate/cinnamic acid dioxygenase small subunit